MYKLTENFEFRWVVTGQDCGDGNNRWIDTNCLLFFFWFNTERGKCVNSYRTGLL